MYKPFYLGVRSIVRFEGNCLFSRRWSCWPGVNVKIQGTTVGTITDIDGNFQLNVNKGAVLEFSYIGFKKQSIKVNSQQMLNVELAPDQTNLDEVVVVGYGKAKRITLTGAVSGIQAREIRNVPTSSVQNALTGKLPGFLVSNSLVNQVKMLQTSLSAVSVH